MRSVTRARYHRAIRHIDKHAKTIRMNKTADAIVSNRSRDLWCESNKLWCSSNLMPCTIVGDNELLVSLTCFLTIKTHYITMFHMTLMT